MADLVALGAAILKSSAVGETLEAKLRAAMIASRGADGWFATDDDMRFRCAVGAVMLVSDEAMRGKIAEECEQLRRFSAFMAAAQAGLSVDPPLMPDGFEPIGLMRIWQESAVK